MTGANAQADFKVCLCGDVNATKTKFSLLEGFFKQVLRPT